MPFNEGQLNQPRQDTMNAGNLPGGDVDSFGINKVGQGVVFNPNGQQATDVANAINPFLQAIFGGSNPFAGNASPLQQQAVGQIGSFLNQPAPETRALGQAQPALQSLLGGQQSQNPFGGFSAGQQVVNAAQPVFNQNLQGALTQVANRAPSVRNAAFGDQASGLAQRALGDFNLFQQQALQQGQQLDLQHAMGNAQLSQQGMLGGLGALGSLSQAAGQNPFARMLGAGGLGNQITQGSINPLLQLMLGGMQFGQQSPLQLAIHPNQGGGGGLGGVLGGLVGAGLGSFTGGIGSNLADRVL